MLKHKAELILFIILVPILAYIAWQAYNTYFKPHSMDIEELEKTGEEKPTEPAPNISAPEKPVQPPEPKGILDYAGYTERDPLRPTLPVKEKAEKPPDIQKPIEPPSEKEIKKEPLKEIILPTFIVTGIVWGKKSPRAIIDHKVYKIGDIIKGAKILDISKKGIHMLYEGKEFWVTIQLGG